MGEGGGGCCDGVGERGGGGCEGGVEADEGAVEVEFGRHGVYECDVRRELYESSEKS